MANDKVILTKEGKKKLDDELRNLIDVVRPEVIDELKAARAQGDLSENADYDAARARQAEVEGRIKQIEDMLANAKIIEDGGRATNGIKVGSRVKIKDLSDNEEYEYLIVGSVEANPLEGKISNECVLAEAILGHKKGEIVTVKVKTPYQVEILDFVNE